MKRREIASQTPLGNQDIANQLVKASSSGVFLNEVDEIMAEKISENRGSIEGGFFRGKDGEVRYVKMPSDGLQSLSEHLANKIYNSLGFPAPTSIVFLKSVSDITTSPKFFYASEKIEFKGDIRTYLTSEIAREFLKGFPLDVLLANRDIVSSIQNTVITKNNRVIRIDSGSALMMRAVNGRKPFNDFYNITEWDGFRNPCINSSYSRIFLHANLSPKERCSEWTQQIKHIETLQEITGGWEKYVDTNVPEMYAF